MEIFGPIPSRRLGKSLGINNLPKKICSFSCIYCQVGNTKSITTKRKEFYSPEKIFEVVRRKIKFANIKKEHIDYLSFVPSGEPTLDINLGEEIDLLKSLGYRIAVFTNASFLLDHSVRQDLSKADLVSVKIDTVDPTIWKKVNRPHKDISHKGILEGIGLFKENFHGRLISETMLVSGVNDGYAHIYDLAKYVGQINPDIAYLSIPTRPPAVPTVEPPNDKRIATCHHILHTQIKHVENLIEHESNDFGFTGDIKNDILNAAGIHPLREDAIAEMLRKADVGWEIIDTLIQKKKLYMTEYNNENYFIRRSVRS